MATELTHSINSRPLLGEVFVSLGLLEKGEVSRFLQFCQLNNIRLGEYLVQIGKVSEMELAQALAQQYNLPFINLRSVQASEEALALIPFKLLESHSIFPFSIEAGLLKVAVFDPLNVFSVQKINKYFGEKFQLYVTSKSQIRSAIESSSVSHKVKAKTVRLKGESLKVLGGVKDNSVISLGQTKSVERLVNNIFEDAISHLASDIHLEPQEDVLLLRERVDGVLEKSSSFSSEQQAAIVSRIKLLAGLDISEKRSPQNGRFYYTYKERRVDMRVSTLPTIRGEKVVIRILDKLNIKLNFVDLGLDLNRIEELKKTLKHTSGLFLVSGPTGSGKTTSMYSMLNHLNSAEKNIVTVEDPVEYEFQMINQVQVNNKSGFSFATLLKDILRQDPDIIMIGEIRDLETARIAVQAALTGHLVISTIHTNNAATAASRLVDLGVEPFLVASSLVGVLSQRLVRKLCTHCRTEINVNKTSNLSALEYQFSKYIDIPYRANGCARCFNTGFSGREGIYEMMIPDGEIRRSMSEGVSSFDLIEMLNDKNFYTMKDDGLDRVKQGLTTIDEVIRVTF